MYSDKRFPAPVTVLNQMVGSIVDALATLCLITGWIIIFMAIYQWTERRKNPLAISLASIITLLVVGTALICVQYLPMHKV